jgi:hypothetical protein
MTPNPSDQTASRPDGFAAGVVLGTLLGGASLFFFQTKTGQKVYTKLVEEYQSGDLDFDRLQAKTNAKLEEFISSTKIFDYVESAFSKHKAKVVPAKPTARKTVKNFFLKKGKKLG